MIMRVSADKNSPYFDYRAICGKVWLDGVELRGCITADDEAGEVECFVNDERGCIVRDSGGELGLKEIRYGKVEIKLATDDEIEAQNKEYEKCEHKTWQDKDQ